MKIKKYLLILIIFFAGCSSEYKTTNEKYNHIQILCACGKYGFQLPAVVDETVLASTDFCDYDYEKISKELYEEIFKILYYVNLY